jgi:hypothetical protein
MSSSDRISQATFDGLAFPVAKVRYTGSGYSASIYRDHDRIYRAKTSYDHAIGGGARGALPAAVKAFEKALADNNGFEQHGGYVAIPGDFSAGLYTFTFVPTHFFDGRAS